MGDWERFGTCIKCGGVIYFNTMTSEMDQSNCIKANVIIYCS